MSQVYRFGRIRCWTRLASLARFAALAMLAVSPGVGSFSGLGAGVAMAGEATTPEGIWYTDERDSIIRVHPCTDGADAFCGMIVWLKEPNESDGTPKVDKLNPDKAKRTRSMIGSDILLGMSEDGDHWKGHAYNPEDGKLYDITFKVKSDKEANDKADLRGCVLRFLCKTTTFERAGEVPGGDPTLTGAAATKKKNKNSARR